MKKYLFIAASIVIAAIIITLTFGTAVVAAWMQITGNVYAIILGNAVFRFVAIKAALIFGFCHPSLESRWPRIPWRVLQFLWKILLERYEKLFVMGRRSSSGFLPTLSTLLMRYRPGHTILGRALLWSFPWIQYVSAPISRHITIFGQTGGGKSNFLALLIAFTSTNASMLIIDPKGMFAKTVLWARQRLGAKVLVIDVLGNTGVNSGSINPVASIAELNRLTGKDYTTIMAVGIAQSLIPTENNQKPFFRNKAVEAFTGFLLHEYSKNPNVSLLEPYDRLTRGYHEHSDNPEEAQQMNLLDMADSQAYDGLVSRIGHMLLSIDERTRSNILASVTEKLLWLNHPQTRQILVRNDAFLTDLKSNERKITIDLACSPFELRTTYAGYFRMMMFMTLKIMELVPGNLEERTRIVFEEMGTIGAVDGVPQVWPMLRGFGGFGIGVVQEIEGLRSAYPDHWRTIMGNSEATVFLQTEDPETLKHISENVLGYRTVKGQRQAVLEPEQVKRFLAYKTGRGGNCIVGMSGRRPLALRMVEYFKDCPVWLYAPDEEHSERTPRAWFRKVWEDFTARRAERPEPITDIPLPLTGTAKLEALARSVEASRHPET